MKRHRNSLNRTYLFGLLGFSLLVAALYVRAYPLSIFEGNLSWVGSGMQLAASNVGMYANVAPNPYNTLALQLQEKDKQLTVREKELATQELAIQQEATLRAAEQNWVIIFVGAVLSFLIALNFYLDYRRRKPLP